MERFHHSGHLTDEALLALIREEPLDELERLELAEHLAFCDQCLQRYTDLLAETALLAPERSCRERLRRRIRERTVRLLTSRYATAAAAVALALTVLWSGVGLSIPRQPFQEAGNAVSERLQRWPERWNESLGDAVSGLNELFDNFGGYEPRDTQGGTHP